MEDLGCMTLSKFRLWSIHALRVYLSRRKRPVDGEFDELAARAFCVWEENLSIDEKAEEAEQRLLSEYRQKLTINLETIPDPFSLTSGWNGEKNGMSSWPSIYITDISEYLKCSTSDDIMKRLMNEYKEGKAYRYFDCGWVKEIYIHKLSDKSDKCVLKTKVTPSQSVNSKFYQAWVVIEKDFPERPGGKILSSYCSCTAGMLGTCNHVAGLLFRVEHAVKTGLTKLSKTSTLSSWNVPKGRPILKALKASEMLWTKGRYGKNSAQDDKRKKHMKMDFTPLNKDQSDQVKDRETLRKDLYCLLKDDIKTSCLSLLIEKRRIPAQTIDLPPSLIDLATQVKKDNPDNTNFRQLYLQKINLDEETISSLKSATIKQSKSPIWINQRKGRITASIFQRVSSRVDTIRQKPDTDPSKLVATIMGQNTVHQTVAMKHGISLEPQAKSRYIKEMRTKHKKFKAKDSGLTIFSEKPFLAASADLETECACCGKGLCEIKCPESIKDQIPTVDNVQCLLQNGANTVLDSRHQYYFQIQGQMRILDRNFCDLYFYTHHGSLCLRIKYDPEFFKRVEEKLNWFWIEFVLPKILNGDTSIPDKENKDLLKKKTKLIPQLCNEHPYVRRSLAPIKLITHIPTQPKKKRKTTNTKQKQKYLCGACHSECIDNPQSELDQSVNCDGCGIWFHYVCAGVDDKKIELIDKWFCRMCH